MRHASRNGMNRPTRARSCSSAVAGGWTTERLRSFGTADEIRETAEAEAAGDGNGFAGFLPFSFLKSPPRRGVPGRC